MLCRNSTRAVVAIIAVLFSIALNNNALGAFTPGDAITYPQVAWRDEPAATSFLYNNYDLVYASSLGIVNVGISGPAGFAIQFAAATFVVDYLPASGSLGPLNADLMNPTSTSSGAFGGEILALRLNIDFSDAGVTLGNLGIPFGNLQLRNFLGSQFNLNDLTVRQVLGQANNLLGGGSSFFFSIPELGEVSSYLNSSFGGGGVSPWAQDHLRVAPSIHGDYNNNGTVDAADYVAWRKGGPLANDSTPGVQPSDYDVWRTRFGQTAGGAGASFANVPEAALTTMVLGVPLLAILRRRRSGG